MGMRNNTRLICVEDVAYQGTLLFWFGHICRSEGISGFHFMPVSPKNQAKNNRIKKGILKFIKGEAYLGPKVRSIYISQALDWNPLKTDNVDDVIDPPGYYDEVMEKYPEYIVKNTFDSDEYAGTAAHEADLSLPF